MNRKKFIYSGLGSLAIPLLFNNNFLVAREKYTRKIRIGIIGLDSTHALAFTKAIQQGVIKDFENDFTVVAAYPYGSKSIPLSIQRIPKFTAEIESLGVKVYQKIEEVLDNVDAVLLETNDGNLHLEQALQIIKRRKPLFIDKPIANSLEDAIKIFKAASKYNCLVFSTSSLRYLEGISTLDLSKVKGSEVYTPAHTEPSHKDLYWYGIHGVEMLIAIMGADCISVRTIEGIDSSLYIGTWSDGRVATLRGIRKGKDDFGGTVFLEDEIITLGKFQGYNLLLYEILKFFKTKIIPVDPTQTLAICAFIDAATESKELGGKEILLKDIKKALE